MRYLLPLILTFLLSFSSCQEDKVYTDEICNDLSMKFFRGLPKPSKEFKDHCGGFNITYTQEKCKSALLDLTLGGDQNRLKKKYGEKIMGCFNRGDLDRFLKN